MKSSDLSAPLRQWLVPLAEYSGAHAIVLPPPSFDVSVAGASFDIQEARQAINRLHQAVARLPNPDLIMRSLDRREAVRSSQIEGTNADVDDVFEYEATGSDAGLPTDVRTTLNYAKALALGLRTVRAGGVAAITGNLVRQLHAVLMDGEEDYVRRHGAPGHFRKKQNWIGGFNIYDAKIVPPPPDRLADVIRGLEHGWQYTPADDSPYEVSIIVRLALMHAHFELAHPFMDGNGRVGRMLMPLMLAAEGYPAIYLSGYLSIHKKAYFQHLGSAQLKGDWTSLVGFLSKAIVASCDDAISTANDLLGIRAGWDDRLGHLRSDAGALRALEALVGSPVVTATILKEKLGISFPAAQNAIEELLGAGVLFETSKKLGRSRAYYAREIVQRLARPTHEPAAAPRNLSRGRKHAL